MSAKVKLVLLVALVGCNAWATEFPYFLQDPLFSRPKILDTKLSMECSDGVSIPAANQALTLAVVVDTAMCNNPQVRNAWAVIKQQAGTLGEARAAYLPVLSTTIGKLRSATRFPDGEFPDTTYNRKTKYANFNWRLYDFGTRSANLTVANHMVAAALASHEAAIQKTINAVVVAYFETMTAHANVKTLSQVVELSSRVLKVAQRREAIGVTSVGESLQASASLAKGQLAMIRAQGDAKKAMAVLLSAMGLPTETVLELPDEPTVVSKTAMSDVTYFLNEAKQKHPEIVAAREQFAASKARVDALIAEGLPTLDFSHNYYQNGFPNQAAASTNSKVQSANLSLNVPLFEGFVRTYKVRGAQAQVEQSQAQLQDTQLRVLADIVKAHASAQASVDNLQASLRLVDAWEAAVQSIENRYAKGVSDITELLSAQNELLHARQERIKSLSDWRAARLQLLASTGIFDKKDLE